MSEPLTPDEKAELLRAVPILAEHMRSFGAGGMTWDAADALEAIPRLLEEIEAEELRAARYHADNVILMAERDATLKVVEAARDEVNDSWAGPGLHYRRLKAAVAEFDKTREQNRS